MIRIITLLLILTLPAIAEARYCSNPYCGMCNRIFGYMKGYGPRKKVTKKVGQEPTPQKMVDGILKAIPPREQTVVYDLGCGDARFLIAAAKKYNIKAVGVEKDKAQVELAYKNIIAAGLTGRIHIIHASIEETDYSDADYIFCYLYPEILDKLDLTKAGVILSYSHLLPESEELTINGQSVYIKINE